jgi:hypothetical protein
VVGVAKSLLNQCEVVSSNPSATPQKNKNKEKVVLCTFGNIEILNI